MRIFFDDADICVIATYTYDEGELPFDLEDFYDELPEQDLSGKVYGVVGSGDSELYPDFFSAMQQWILIKHLLKLELQKDTKS